MTRCPVTLGWSLSTIPGVFYFASLIKTVQSVKSARQTQTKNHKTLIWDEFILLLKPRFQGICLKCYLSVYLCIDISSYPSFLPSSGLINSGVVDTSNIILLSNLMLLICVKITETFGLPKKSINYLTWSWLMTWKMALLGFNTKTLQNGLMDFLQGETQWCSTVVSQQQDPPFMQLEFGCCPSPKTCTLGFLVIVN